MYHEIFDELRYCETNSLELAPIQLLNKSLIDSFYDVRSQINPIYDENNDHKRLVGSNYPYLFYQKMITGIAKAVFVGFNPWSLGKDIFLPSGRLKVPTQPLIFNYEYPLIYFNQNIFSYDNSSLKKWEDEILASAPFINANLNISITKDGIRANLYRVLEILFSMRSSSNKRRTNWTIFLHELLIQGRVFTQETLEQLGFSIHQTEGFTKVIDTHFPTHDYLEFRYLRNLNEINYSAISNLELSGSAMDKYMQFNNEICGKVPLVHFGINEHMFVYKEEYSLEQYINFYVYPWTKASQIFLTYIDNIEARTTTSSIEEFKSSLSRCRYAIVLGFFEKRDGKELNYYSEPRMVKG
jgi:hypothetical protein